MITEEEYRDTAISPAYNLLLAVRQRRLPRDSVVRRTLIAMTDGDNPNRYPEGSIFMDCQGSELKDLETLPGSEPRHCMAAQSGGTCVNQGAKENGPVDPAMAGPIIEPANVIGMWVGRC